MATVAVVFGLAPGALLLRSALDSQSGVALRGAAGGPRGSPTGAACTPGRDCAGQDGAATAPEGAAAGYLRLHELVNAERKRAGCPALRLEDRLMISARSHAADMAARAFSSLTNPDGEGPGARARKVGYQGKVTEIIAVGLPAAEEVFRQWTNPSNPAAKAVTAKIKDCSRVSAGTAYHPAQIKPTYGQGIWVLDMGDT